MAAATRRWAIAVFALIVAGIALLALGRAGNGAEAGAQGPVLLFTTLPILWPETNRLDQSLDSAGDPHWALAVLGERGEVRGLDALAGEGGASAIGEATLLVMAQPRPLSPEENVALDGWVRAGGRVLLFADPMLTAESAFPLGDRRRPQDVVLLSPILTRWGLALEFDEDQPAGEREGTVLGEAAPVNLPGRFTAAGGAGGCAIRDRGLVAECRIGAGTVLALADAALLQQGEQARNLRNPRVSALRRLLDVVLS